MFAELPRHWTPVLASTELRAAPVPLTLAGERIVLFRGTDGPSALIDRCPHRGVALSLGRVVDGCLECPFHGWRFRGDGACAHVPLNPDARTELLGARALPVREAGGLVWVFTGEQAEGEPVVPEALTRAGVRRTYIAETWRAHWTRAMENMLDVPHLPYVHRRTIGRGMRVAMRPDSQVHQELSPTAHGFELRFSLGQQPLGRLDWVRPNSMVLYILDEPSRLMRMHVWCVPAEENHTRMIISSAQDFGALTPLAALGDWFNRRILTEDRSIVESSSPARVPPPGAEKSVASDKATLRFRSWYHQTIAEVAHAAAAQGGAGDVVQLRARAPRRSGEAV